MAALCLMLIPAALLFPKQILVQMPYGLFESSRTIVQSSPDDLKTQYPSLQLPAQFNADEPKRPVRSEVVERTVFGRWTHYYATTTWDPRGSTDEFKNNIKSSAWSALLGEMCPRSYRALH